jgi:cytochrome P450
MKEAMRLHPGVGFPLERLVPSEGATVCGVTLPSRTIISMSAPVVQLDRSVFGDDATEFRPERWIDEDPEQLKVMDRSLLMVRIRPLLQKYRNSKMRSSLVTVRERALARTSH